MDAGVAATEYHEQTKHTSESLRHGPGLDFDNKPRPYKTYDALPRVPLADNITEPTTPILHAIANQSEPTPATVERETVADLCYYAAGVTKTLRLGGREHDFRAAACTGALYHIDLYPVCGDLDGLDAGVYHFDPHTNALDQLRTGDYRGILADATQAATVEHAPVTFVATSTWWRNAWKYRARTYRHAFWDAGTILANLLATSHAHHHPAEIVVGFADNPVAHLVGIEPEWEAPVALAAIGTGAPAVDPTDEATVEPIDPATAPLESDPQDYPLIHHAWAASTLPDGATAHEWRTSGGRPVDARGPASGDWIELDPHDPANASRRPLHQTIKRRGSCRAYDRDPLAFQTVSTVLDRAIRGPPMDVRESPETATASLQFVDCYCIVNGVDELPPGAYQYHPDAGALERLHAGEYRQAAGHLALGQRLGADAAICIYFMADLAAVTDVLGDRGYRAAQLEAAVTAGRLYLATYAHPDLGGTGLTFFDDHVTDFFEPRAKDQTPMFLYTIGRPA